MSRDLVVALSGGIGGAKLALGLSRILPPDNLLVVANVGDDFEHFVEGTVAAREDEESVGESNHAGFALVHGGDGFEPREVLVGDFAVGEDLGEDADDFGPAG